MTFSVFLCNFFRKLCLSFRQTFHRKFLTAFGIYQIFVFDSFYTLQKVHAEIRRFRASVRNYWEMGLESDYIKIIIQLIECWILGQIGPIL